MNRRNLVTHTVQILDIICGEPAQILTAKQSVQEGKPGRLFQQLVPVPDAELFERFVAQVKKRDTVRVTVQTEWRDEGYSVALKDFALMPLQAEASEERVA